MRISKVGLLVCLASSIVLGDPATPFDTWPAVAKEGPLLVRLSDGRTLEVSGPVHGDERTLLLRLADDTLLSVETASVEAIDEAPSRARAAATRAENANRPVVISNADLPEALPSQSAPIQTPDAPAGGNPPEAGPPAEQPTAASIYPGEHLDRNGHNERWWRDRVARLREALAQADADIERLEAEVRVAKARSLGAHQAQNKRVSSLDKQKVDTLVDAVDSLEATRARRDELQAEIDGLADEARLANALPGWLR